MPAGAQRALRRAYDQHQAATQAADARFQAVVEAIASEHDVDLGRFGLRILPDGIGWTPREAVATLAAGPSVEDARSAPPDGPQPLEEASQAEP